VSAGHFITPPRAGAIRGVAYAVHIVGVAPERDPVETTAALPDIEITPVRGALTIVSDSVGSLAAAPSVIVGLLILVRLAFVLYKRHVRDWRDVRVLQPLSARVPPPPAAAPRAKVKKFD